MHDLTSTSLVDAISMVTRSAEELCHLERVMRQGVKAVAGCNAAAPAMESRCVSDPAYLSQVLGIFGSLWKNGKDQR